jgi:hypothetical protein
LPVLLVSRRARWREADQWHRESRRFGQPTTPTGAHRRGPGARFSVTIRIDTKIRTRCESIGEDAWVDIKYPQAIWDEDEQRWISDAQIAETTYTAFEGTRHAITARLIARRVKRLDPQQVTGQGELFDQYRYHAVFTDSPFILVQAEFQHRGHAVIEQVNADLIEGPLAHLPSGRFAANGAWLACAAIAHNLTRAADTWPHPATPSPAPLPSAPNSSTSPPAWPTAPAASTPRSAARICINHHQDPQVGDLTELNDQRESDPWIEAEGMAAAIREVERLRGKTGLVS